MIEIKTFEAYCGETLTEAIKEAIHLANVYDCIIYLIFNDTRLKVYAFSSVQTIIDMYKQNNNQY